MLPLRLLGFFQMASYATKHRHRPNNVLCHGMRNKGVVSWPTKIAEKLNFRWEIRLVLLPFSCDEAFLRYGKRQLATFAFRHVCASCFNSRTVCEHQNARAARCQDRLAMTNLKLNMKSKMTGKCSSGSDESYIHNVHCTKSYQAELHYCY